MRMLIINYPFPDSLLVCVVKVTMGKIYCCAQDCSNFSGKKVKDRKISLHRFPASLYHRRIWIRRVQNHRQNFKWSESKLKTARLCSDHFVGNKGPTKEIPIPSVFPQKIYKSYTVIFFIISPFSIGKNVCPALTKTTTNRRSAFFK